MRMTRRELREHKFRLLFSSQYYGREDGEGRLSQYFALSDYEDGFGTVQMEALGEEDREVISASVRGVLDRIQELDEAIDAVAEGWTTQRMASTDLNVLRLALYEILYDEAIPVGVAVNEAVDLAKRYGGEESGSFVNGILGRCIRKEKKAAQEAGEDSDDTSNGKTGGGSDEKAAGAAAGRRKPAKGELSSALRRGRKVQVLVHGSQGRTAAGRTGERERGGGA